ncbi:MAG: hypothetical protein MHM6MM_005691 [Cercozoa sp. M6MM]
MVIEFDLAIDDDDELPPTPPSELEEEEEEEEVKPPLPPLPLKEDRSLKYLASDFEPTGVVEASTSPTTVPQEPPALHRASETRDTQSNDGLSDPSLAYQANNDTPIDVIAQQQEYQRLQLVSSRLSAVEAARVAQEKQEMKRLHDQGEEQERRLRQEEADRLYAMSLVKEDIGDNCQVRRVPVDRSPTMPTEKTLTAAVTEAETPPTVPRLKLDTLEPKQAAAETDTLLGLPRSKLEQWQQVIGRTELGARRFVDFLTQTRGQQQFVTQGPLYTLLEQARQAHVSQLRVKQLLGPRT